MRGLPGTAEMSQIYRTDLADKPTRPAGTVEGAPPTTQKLQEQGDHVYTTNKAFEKTKTPGTLHVDGVSLGWREEAARGFVRELTPSPSLQLPVNAPLYGDEIGSDATGSVSTTTTITVSPSLATILLPETLLTGLYAATATSGTAPVSVGLIAVPAVTNSGSSFDPAPETSPTRNDDATKAFTDAAAVMPLSESIDQFWQSLSTSLEPALLV